MKTLAVLALSATSLFGLDVSGQRIRAHTRFLSSDLMEGRGVGTRGGQLATDYIATELELAGVKPGGENGSYFQTVPLVGVEPQPETSLSATKGKQTVRFDWQKDFVGVTHMQKPQVNLDAEAIFVGHGIVAPEFQWDDFKGVDVRGKVLVLFTNEPASDDPKFFGGRALTYYGRWVYKYEQAERMGAAAVLIIHTTPTAGYGWEVVRNSWGKEAPQMILAPDAHPLALAGWTTQEAGQKLLAMAGRNVDELLKLADSRDFKPIPLGIRIRGNFPSKVRQISTRNVVGIVPGSDPQKSAETVMFSAHWDHLGIGTPVNGDKIYNGALDNATGCALVLELARAWAELDKKPARSAMFLFVTAEESGLLGSEYYALHPIRPPAKTALALNFDMFYPLGRTLDVVTSGAERTTFWPMVQNTAKRFRYEIMPDPRPEQGSYYRSDHFSFAKAGIPAFTVAMGRNFAGKPPEFAAEAFKKFNANSYHQPSDEYHEEWDFSGMEQLGKFSFTLGLEAADMERLPTWKPGDEFLPAREKSFSAK